MSQRSVSTGNRKKRAPTILWIGLGLALLTSPGFPKQPPELTESPFGVNVGNFLVRLFWKAQHGDVIAQQQIDRRFQLLDSLQIRWLRFDANLATLFPDLAVNRSTRDTLRIRCTDSIDFQRFVPIFRFSPLKSALVRSWRQGIRPVLVLAYIPSWASTDPCPQTGRTAGQNPRCFGQFLPKSQAWKWLLNTLKDSLDLLLESMDGGEVQLPLYLQVWNEPNNYLYVSSLYDCASADSVVQGIRCPESSSFLSLRAPKDPRRRICYVAKIYQHYVDSLLVPALEVFGQDPRYRILTAGPGVDPVWSATRPSWFAAFRVLATRLRLAWAQRALFPLPTGISIHWYHHQGKDSEDAGIQKHFLHTLQATRETLRVYAPELRLDTLPIWVTEFGRYTARSPEDGSTEIIEIERSSKTLVHLYELLFSPSFRTGLNLGPAFLYRLVDLPRSRFPKAEKRSYGLASYEFLSLPASRAWREALKPTAYLYQNLSLAWSQHTRLPMADPDGIRPDLVPPGTLWRNRIFLAYRGSLWENTQNGTAQRVPSIWVAELTLEGEILRTQPLGPPHQPSKNVTVPSFSIVQNDLYLLFGAGDSLYIWKWDREWRLTQTLSTGIRLQQVFILPADPGKGVLVGTQNGRTLVKELRYVQQKRWQLEDAPKISVSRLVPLSSDGQGLWGWQPRLKRLVYFPYDGSPYLVDVSSIIQPVRDVAVVSTSSQGSGIFIQDDKVTFIEWTRSPSRRQWWVTRKVEDSVRAPRSPGLTWDLSESRAEPVFLQWLTVVDSVPMEGTSSEQARRPPSRSKIVLYHVTPSGLQRRTVYESPLYLRHPFLLRWDHRVLLGVLEGAYGHYVLRLLPFKI